MTNAERRDARESRTGDGAGETTSDIGTIKSTNGTNGAKNTTSAEDFTTTSSGAGDGANPGTVGGAYKTTDTAGSLSADENGDIADANQARSAGKNGTVADAGHAHGADENGDTADANRARSADKNGTATDAGQARGADKTTDVAGSLSAGKNGTAADASQAHGADENGDTADSLSAGKNGTVADPGQARGAAKTTDPADSPRPDSTGKGDAPSSSWMRRLAAASWVYRRSVLVALGGSLMAMLATAAMPLVQRHIIDDVVISRRSALAPWAAVALVLAVVNFGGTRLRRYVGGKLSLDVQYDLRNRIFGALSRLDGARQDELATGQLISRATSDVTMVQGLLGMLPMLIGNALLFVVALTVMAFLSPLLTLVALATGPGLWFVAVAARRRLYPATWEAQQQASALAGVVDAAVGGVRVVKGFGQEEQELGKLEAAGERLFASRLRAVRFSARYNPAIMAIPALGQVGVLFLGGWLALRGMITLGTFLAFSTYLAQMLGPVRMLSSLVTIGQQARASVERIFEIIDSQPKVTEKPDAAVLPRETSGVEFDGAVFGYVASRPVLRGLDLKVRPGETVALVGTSGSGKSTVSMLLPRFYDVQGGSVRVGGADVREVTLESLRAAIGLVMEDSFLFSDSVRANIAYGRPDATDEQVRAAARMAEADEFVEQLPAGYDTVVGEQGLTLSGGQRQRIALARALITDPRVLILDDATSAVDARVEAEIHDTLRRVMAGRTTLLIAHRRSTLALADRIAVLDRGRVVDIGTHEELTERCPLYRLLLSGPGEDAEGIDAGDLTTAATARAKAANGSPAVALHGSANGTASNGHAPGTDRTDATSTIEAQVDGITPSLWPSVEGDDGPAGAKGSGTGALPGMGGGGGAGRGVGGGGGGGFGGFLASMPPTPELLAKVAALPPATDEPKVGQAEARASDPDFSLRKLLRPFRLALLLGLLLVAADTAAGLALPALIRGGVDRGILAHSLSAIVGVSVAALLVTLTDSAINVCQYLVTGRTGERLLYALRVKVFAQLQRLGLDYYERELSGRIMTRMTTDVDALSTFLQTGLQQAVVSVLSFVGIVVALVVIDWRMALIALSVLPPLLIATAVFRAKSSKAYTEAREKVAAVNADLQENVAGMRVTQAFRREGTNATRFAGLSDEFRVSRLRAQKYIATYFPFVQLLADVAGLLVLAAGASRVHSGELTAGALIAYLLYIDMVFSPVQQLSQVFDGYQQAAVGLRRIGDLLRTAPSTPEPARPVPVPTGLGEIVFDDVTFAYGPDTRPALESVSVRIPAGQTVALVGQTGAGKSTFVKMVARFYDPTGGAVTAGGRDLREFALPDWRHRLGVVPQEAYLFDGTVAEAIAYARPDAPPREIEAAARAVGAEEMIAGLPEGFHSRVAERGRNLSAGQRQLLALARAELADPDVLILDEATSSLDLATEAAVTHAELARSADHGAAGRTRTTLVVAHRLTTAARADRILVLDGGRIVEDGTHTELVERGGTYSALWEAFAAGHEDGERETETAGVAI
ncbi:ABC transporter related [Catenulispora acidiphila DSM 44928]|uniref:ABC transporter related n=2 Tax=Catenulispora TaxID=414878 RepID=C7Q7Y8_CATAD|nr:ABC transporter transmembrane domain-containing protein [Catenulispora acidiphila]ACU74155.1 ABC transporter related [Catenulispora acidiphila DSM 44928]